MPKLPTKYVLCASFQAEQKSLADKFEYIMHGLVYNLAEEGSGSEFKVYVI